MLALRVRRSSYEVRPSRLSEKGGCTQSAFFGWRSAQKVIDEVSRGGKQRGNQRTFEDRWRYRGYCIQDLLTYSL